MNNLTIFLALIIAFTTTFTNAQSVKKDTFVRYAKVNTGYLVVLRQGDNLFEQLEKIALVEKIPAANFTGMGFVSIRFGFFNFLKKEFLPKDFKNVELASMQGTIAWKGSKPSIHCHGVIAGADFLAHGGHILSATVGTVSLEIMIIVHDKKLERKKHETVGADVLQLE